MNGINRPEESEESEELFSLLFLTRGYLQSILPREALVIPYPTDLNNNHPS